MRSRRLHLAWCGFLALVLSLIPVWVSAANPPAHDPPLLSPYWNYKVQRWDWLIQQEAERRSLDPDFLAALIWQESRGNADAIGPGGSVGLMQVMPYEAGFTWRPTRDELTDPWLNLFWGTRTLTIIIQQGRGDIFNSLAAYNAGWDQIHLRRPRYFATTILRDYARAVVLRRGLEETAHWTAYFAVLAPALRGPIWIADSARDDVFYFGERNQTPEGAMVIPETTPPTALVAQWTEDDGAVYQVGLWLYLENQGQWVTP